MKYWMRTFAAGAATYAIVAACGSDGDRNVTAFLEEAGTEAGIEVDPAEAGRDVSRTPSADVEPDTSDPPSMLEAAVDRATSPVRDARAENVDGDRIKTRHLVADDGARIFMGWHDSQFDEQCSFQKASDGVWRCLPFSPPVADVLYADQACTDPVAFMIVNNCSDPSDLALITGTRAGCDGSDYALLGAEISAPSTVYQNDGGCVETTAPNADLVRRVVEILPPTRFVGSSIEIGP